MTIGARNSRKVFAVLDEHIKEAALTFDCQRTLGTIDGMLL